MKNSIKCLIFFMLCSLSLFTLADTTVESVADVKIQLINNMHKDGYITEQNVKEITEKYITDTDTQTVIKSPETLTAEKVAAKQESSWKDYLSLVNFIKIAAILLVLVACAGLIKKMILACWLIIAAVPVIVYQTVFLAGSITGTLFPEIIWASQAIYIAIFCSFLNLILLFWVIESHEPLQAILERLFNFGIPVECVVCFYGLLYFTGLTLYYESSIFGFFAVICLSGLLYSICVHVPKLSNNMFRDKELNSFVLSHLFIVAVYAALHATGIANHWLSSFDIGFQYYCTIALCGSLLVSTSPFFHQRNLMIHLIVFTSLFVLSVFGYFFWDLKVMSSIIMASFALFLLIWISYIGFKGGVIIGTGTLGILLYGLSLLLEKYGSIIVASFY